MACAMFVRLYGLPARRRLASPPLEVGERTTAGTARHIRYANYKGIDAKDCVRASGAHRDRPDWGVA